MVHGALFWMLCAGAPASPGSWTADSRSQGGAAIHLEATPGGDDLHLTLTWPKYEATTIDASLPVVPGCASSVFDDIRERVDGPCRSVSGRVRRLHPTYGYVEQDHLRCAFADDAAPMWCRLPFTGWIELTRAGEVDDVTEAARRALRAHIADPLTGPVADPQTLTAEGYCGVKWTEPHEIVPVGEEPSESRKCLGANTFHLIWRDGDGRPVQHTAYALDGPATHDVIVWDDAGRAVRRETRVEGRPAEVRLVHMDRGEPAVFAWGAGELVYLLKALR